MNGKGRSTIDYKGTAPSLSERQQEEANHKLFPLSKQKCEHSPIRKRHEPSDVGVGNVASDHFDFGIDRLISQR